jgi:hypothetical protein
MTTLIQVSPDGGGRYIGVDREGQLAPSTCAYRSEGSLSDYQT